MFNLIFGLLIAFAFAIGGLVLSMEIHKANREKEIVDYDYNKEYKL